MNAIVSFFAGIGKLLGKALGLVRERITDEQLALALGYVKEQEDKAIDNAAKRNFVLTALMKVPGISESIGRLLIELAVNMIKKEAHELTDKAADRI